LRAAPSSREGGSLNASPQLGVVAALPNVTILDSREMEWTEHESMAGVRTKVLSRDAHGDPAVSLLWYPPGSPGGDVKSIRRRHRTVRERIYVLSGDFPTWEYDDADSPGSLFELKPDYFVDRLPGAVHGYEPGPVSQVGCVLLVIQDGPGLHPGEKGFDRETATVRQADR
jgi:hypothetical protein